MMWSLHHQRLWVLALCYGMFLIVRAHPVIEVRPILSDLVSDVAEAGRAQAEAEGVQTRALLTFEKTLLGRVTAGLSQHDVQSRP